MSALRKNGTSQLALIVGMYYFKDHNYCTRILIQRILPSHIEYRSELLLSKRKEDFSPIDQSDKILFPLWHDFEPYDVDKLLDIDYPVDRHFSKMFPGIQ